MKSPRPKIHLLDVYDPLFAFRQLEMRCGVTLENAVQKFSFSEDLRHEINLPLGVCIDCLKASPTIPSLERHYLYGLVEGEEEKAAHTDETEEVAA